jgi:muramoyltetrapeptide carboxypeptidase
MMRTLPKFLKPGNRVAISATARGIDAKDLRPIVQFLQSLKLEVVLCETIDQYFGQLSGTIASRTNALQKLLDDSNLHAIVFARGGYGTIQIIDNLNWELFNQHPKWIVGFSDLTALLCDLQHYTSSISVHGPMGSTWPKTSPEAQLSLRDLLLGNRLPDLSFPIHPANQGEAMSGILTGGNLSVLYSLSGSPSQVRPTGHILFLEDLDEYLYHIDRMMRNLSRSGWLEGLNGLLIGSFTDMHDHEVPYGKDAVEILSEIADQHRLPIIFGTPAGHQPHNFPLLMGAPVNISTSDHQTHLTYMINHG